MLVRHRNDGTALSALLKSLDRNVIDGAAPACLHAKVTRVDAEHIGIGFTPHWPLGDGAGQIQISRKHVAHSYVAPTHTTRATKANETSLGWPSLRSSSVLQPLDRRLRGSDTPTVTWQCHTLQWY